MAHGSASASSWHGPHLGEAGPELVGSDVVAVLEAVVDRLGDDLGPVAGQTPPAASYWATASVSNIKAAYHVAGGR